MLHGPGTHCCREQVMGLEPHHEAPSRLPGSPGDRQGEPQPTNFLQNPCKGGWKTPSPPADTRTAGELPPRGETRLSRKPRSSASSVLRPGSAGPAPPCPPVRGVEPPLGGHLPSVFPAHQDSRLGTRTPNPPPSGPRITQSHARETACSEQHPGPHRGQLPRGGRQGPELPSHVCRAQAWPDWAGALQ